MAKKYRYVLDEKGEYACDPRAFSPFENIMAILGIISILMIPVSLIENIWWDKWPTEKCMITSVIVLASIVSIMRFKFFYVEQVAGKKILQWREEYRLVEEYNDESDK